MRLCPMMISSMKDNEMRLCPMMISSMKDNAGQMPEPGVTVITVISLRLGVSVDNRWITFVRSVRSNIIILFIMMVIIML
jgi:hypothetical protein